VEFETSPKMSTYLLALMVAPHFDYTSSTTSRGLPIRAWAPKNLKSQTVYAASMVSRVTEFYEHYFGMEYVLPKIDVVAVADFAAGAMVN
jgi:aminopeptidase N